MTGLEAYTVGILRPISNPSTNPTGLPLEYKILPEYFKEAGYQTALVGKWHLGMNSKEYLPGQRGFDTTYGFMNGGIDYFNHTMSGRLDWHKNGVPLREEGYSTDLIANEAIKVIQNKQNNKPLLLYVAFNAPHTPIQAPYENIEKFGYIDDPKERIYAANISILDKQIGRIIDSIKDEELSSNTLILFFPAGSNSVNYYELFNIIEDPLEEYDLSEDYPDIFNLMKETLNKVPKRNLQGYPDASYLYLHGDRMLSEESGTPWLNYDFELVEKPSPIIGTLIFVWILLLANKTYATLFILLAILLIYSIKQKIKRG